MIVYATGFHATEYLYPMTITGRGGQTIEDLWAKDGARAYLGCMMPGFPNLWSIYGPNTNGGLTVAAFHEMIAHYALQCMETLILGNGDAMEVRPEAYWRYNHMVDERNLDQGVERSARPELLLDRPRPLGGDEPVLHRRDVGLPAQARPRRPGDRLRDGGGVNVDEQQISH